MAEKIITLRICDICGEEGDKMTVVIDGMESQVDLCPAHAKPVRDVLKAAQVGGGVKTPDTPPTARKARSRASGKPAGGSRITVTPMPEVQNQIFRPPGS